MNKTYRIISAVLLASMVAGMTACGQSSDSPSSQTSSAGETSADTTAAETSVTDYLPKNDFGGDDFTLLIRENYEYEFEAPEETGDLINDAIYARNRAVEDQYNINLKTIVQTAQWGGSDTFNKSLTNTIMAGDAAYDLVAGYAAMILGSIQKGYFIDWYDLPVVDVTQSWWSEQIADCLTVNGKMYAMTGDIALSIWTEMEAIYFNQVLAENYGVNDLYDLVRNGTWTFDKLEGYSKLVSGDINGDGKYTEADLYGYASVYTTEIDTFMPAFDIKVLSKDESGDLVYSVNNERTIGALEKLADMFFGGGNFAYLSSASSQAEFSVIFKENRALFMPGYLKLAEGFRDMESNFGILPYPKYDETQDKYYSTSRDNFSLMLIPATVTDLEEAGTITEALCVYSYDQVIPVYYDTVLKDKYSRDADSAEMLDIIRDSLIYDIGYLNSYALDGAGHIFVELVRKGGTDFASSYAKKEASITAKLETMLEAYAD